MTEAEWLATDDCGALMQWLAKHASSRKCRLYLCGGCQTIRDLFFCSSSAKAVEVAERMADELASETEIKGAYWGAKETTFGHDFEEDWVREDFTPFDAENHRNLVRLGAISASAMSDGPWLVNDTIRDQLIAAACIAMYCLTSSFVPNLYPVWNPVTSIFHYAAQIDWPGRWLIDCVYGNPFRLVRADPAWLAWKSGTVPAIARRIYDEKAFGDLPILADALEEAGCSNPAMIVHCRDDHRHVRGCWVLDCLLGLE
jgi:hypothetical protein